MSEKGFLKITLVKSTIGFDKKQAKVVESIGLRRLRHTVELRDTPETRGMIQKVRHLVTVEESASAGTEPGRASARPRRSLGEGGN
jgi:large subunit ribosomal protein L30